MKNQNTKKTMTKIEKTQSILRKTKLTLTALAVMMTALSGTVFAADPLSTINSLSDFIFSAIKAIGFILLGFGVVQIGLSLKSHDASQRANGFLTFFGGVIIAFAKDILDLIM
ncbi:MAG: glutamyl-tRNA amidotransferase [Clostridiales bacterium]|nr:MAG: glutamyl-tRNA amidotransferase [Clostridiales bacterium]